MKSTIVFLVTALVMGAWAAPVNLAAVAPEPRSVAGPAIVSEEVTSRSNRPEPDGRKGYN